MQRVFWGQKLKDEVLSAFFQCIESIYGDVGTKFFAARNGISSIFGNKSDKFCKKWMNFLLLSLY